MGLRDMLKDKKMILSDKDIVYDMLKDSKFELIGLTFALAECNNPQLRLILLDQFNRCVIDHHALTDLALKKNWSTANAAPLDQIQIDLVDSEHVLS
jgi:similar to spore coat protein